MTEHRRSRTGPVGPRPPGRGAASRWAAAAACAGLLFAALVPAGPAAAQASPVPKVGVVDFYAPTPLAVYNGTVPERVAADDLARMLARAGEGRIDVIPRTSVRQAQRAMRWQNQDVLDFKRLSALASAVGADRLVLGWIPILSVGGNGNTVVPEGAGAPLAQATLVVQVFDPAAERIVDETRVYGTAVGGLQYQLVIEVLDDALRQVVQPVLHVLMSPIS